MQWCFDWQVTGLKRYANERGVRIIPEENLSAALGEADHAPLALSRLAVALAELGPLADRARLIDVDYRDRIVIRVTMEKGHGFLDRMIAMVEGAKRQKTPNEIALAILLVAPLRLKNLVNLDIERHLIGRDGKVVAAYSSMTDPLAGDLVKDIESRL